LPVPTAVGDDRKTGGCDYAVTIQDIDNYIYIINSGALYVACGCDRLRWITGEQTSTVFL